MPQLNRHCPSPGVVNPDCSQEFCDVGAGLRQFLIDKLRGCVGDRVHQDHVPQPLPCEQVGGKKGCYRLSSPYVWISRSGTTHVDRCLGGSGGVPDEESWDVEVVSPDIGIAQRIARLIQGCDSYKGRASPDLWLDSLFVDDQNDTYRYRGIAESYIEGGVEVASFLITICPVCISKG